MDGIVDYYSALRGDQVAPTQVNTVFKAEKPNDVSWFQHK